MTVTDENSLVQRFEQAAKMMKTVARGGVPQIPGMGPMPGMGGLQLVDRDDVAEFYEPGTEVLVFHDADELVELGRRIVADPAWGTSIREAGRRRSHAEHTFAHRARMAQEWWA